MKLESLVLKCESVPAPSLAAGILLVFPHLPERLVSLRLTSLSSITQLLLKEIAGRCVNLRELELSVVQRLSTDCCWLCFEESSSSNEHSPVGSEADLSTAGDLAVSDCPYLVSTSIYGICSPHSCRRQVYYAKYLRPLENLKRLSLGVFLSSPVVLREHIDNHSLEREDCQLTPCTLDDSFSAPHTPAVDGQEGRPRVHPYRKSAGGDVTIVDNGIAIGCRPYTPSKCSLCWEAHGLRTRKDELMATMRLAQNLKNLDFVRWSSWFNPMKTMPGLPDRSPVNDIVGKYQTGMAELKDAQWATFEIKREEQRIKVWRRTCD
ncbi:hypothetical protein BGY98DRAFT_1095046 [Russula aff. rugulosa BPL654]|nr:hypothetical protein BGY98DRAFT_1095046 [Russula aff. rugulosa BPL654]